MKKVLFPSPRVQRLHRPSILCNARLVLFIRCQEPFCLQRISDNGGKALFIKCHRCLTLSVEIVNSQP